MSKQRLEFIDAIRGLAASYVVLYHLVFLPIPKLTPPKWMESFVLLGGSGVALFFVLSAFTMCLTMEKRRHQAHATRGFYLRRFFRIAPLFYALLIVMLLFDFFIFEKTHSIKEVLLSAFFGFNLFPEYVSGIVMASWTIGVEMLFYLMFPFIFRFVYSLPRAVLFLLAMLILDHYFGVGFRKTFGNGEPLAMFNHMNIIHQLPVFAMGFCAYYFRKIVGLSEQQESLLGWLLLLASGAVFFQIMNGYIVPIGAQWHFQAFIYTLFVLGLAYVQPRIIINKLSQFLGNISYSLYLNHALLIVILVGLSGPFTLPSSEPWFYLLCIFIVFLILVPLSYLTFRYIEQPGILRSRNFINSLKKSTAATISTDSS